MNLEKACCFTGYFFDKDYNGNLEEKLTSIFKNLIDQGYYVFYDNNRGAFSWQCARILINLKKDNPNIKIYKVLIDYTPQKVKIKTSKDYTDTIMPVENQLFYKKNVDKVNEWIVNNSDIVICNKSCNTDNYSLTMINYAEFLNKEICYVE